MRIKVIGNSGSGKSTLAKTLAHGRAIPTSNLDTICWEPGQVVWHRLSGSFGP